MMAATIAEPSPQALARRFRAPGGWPAFRHQVEAARCCRRPVRLAGQVSHVDDGKPQVVFDTRSLPDGVLLKACGTRRESLCPPCAAIYRADAFQLVAAGLRGGKGIESAVACHPAVMVTLTAPSFGAVHRIAASGTCHPGTRRCRHGRVLACHSHHRDDDPILGTPLCSRCYDYTAAVVFNARVTELWRRTSIYALRALGELVGTSTRCVAQEVRLSYVKVVEYQKRGSVHLHALVRLDARDDSLSPPPEAYSAEVLAQALLRAAARVSAPAAPGEIGGQRVVWGDQREVAIVTDDDRARSAFYLAKYATKGVEATGALDHRLGHFDRESLDIDDHLCELVAAAWSLGDDPRFAALRPKSWAHMLCFRGHVVTKSKRYSTTFRSLRDERRRHVVESIEGAEASGDEVARWRFVGIGYTDDTDAYLAAMLADEEREARLAARQALREDEL